MLVFNDIRDRQRARGIVCGMVEIQERENTLRVLFICFQTVHKRVFLGWKMALILTLNRLIGHETDTLIIVLQVDLIDMSFHATCTSAFLKNFSCHFSTKRICSGAG